MENQNILEKKFSMPIMGEVIDLEVMHDENYNVASIHAAKTGERITWSQVILDIVKLECMKIDGIKEK